MTGILETAAAIAPAVLPTESTSASTAAGESMLVHPAHAHQTESADGRAPQEDNWDSELAVRLRSYWVQAHSPAQGCLAEACMQG